LSSQGRVLFIGDSSEAWLGLGEPLIQAGHVVERLNGAPQAPALEEGQDYDLILVDLAGPGDGPELIRELIRLCPRATVTALGREDHLGQAVAAVKAGAADCWTPPFRAEAAFELLEQALRTVARPGRVYPFGPIIGRSAGIQRVFDLIARVADSDSTVLIAGESGTGKELMARAIHFSSPRRDKPLVPVNCGAIPEELLESELFGHEKGAFTSAIRTRIGRFELADGGTIFLDEIGEMSPKLQVKLLRVLQERQFERVGGTKTIRSDIRVIAATNQDLRRAVAQGRFREDLYYRLSVIPIPAPSLRERAEDIPLLVDHFLERFRRSRKTRVKGVSPEALELLKRYAWPGNIRELENLIERLVILSDNPRIAPADLPERFHHAEGRESSSVLVLPEEGLQLNETLAAVEDQLIRQALAKSGGIKSRAAKLLGLNRTTLVEKLKKKKMV